MGCYAKNFSKFMSLAIVVLCASAVNAGVTHPTDGSVVTDGSVTITWTGDAREYWVRVYDDGEKIIDSGRLSNSVIEFTTALPQDGSEIVIEHHTKVNGDWSSTKTVITSVSGTDDSTPEPPVIDESDPDVDCVDPFCPPDEDEPNPYAQNILFSFQIEMDIVNGNRDIGFALNELNMQPTVYLGYASPNGSFDFFVKDDFIKMVSLAGKSIAILRRIPGKEFADNGSDNTPAARFLNMGASIL